MAQVPVHKTSPMSVTPTRSTAVMRYLEVLSDLADHQHGIVSWAQLRDAGVTESGCRHLVDRGVLVHIRRRVYGMAGRLNGWHSSLMSACLTASGVLGSHRSATRLWGMRSVDENVDVTIPYPRRLTIDGVKVHRSRDLAAEDWSWVDGIPVTSPVRTLCDAGLVFPEHETRRMVDHAVATGLVTSRDLWRFRIRVGKQGRNGCGVLHRVLESLPPGSETLESGLEVALARIVDTARLPSPVYQHPVVVGGDRYRLDAAYPRLRLFIEVDGVATHSSPAQIAADGGRQNRLVTAGWRPLRFVWSDLRDRPAMVADVIRRSIGFCEPEPSP